MFDLHPSVCNQSPDAFSPDCTLTSERLLHATSKETQPAIQPGPSFGYAFSTDVAANDAYELSKECRYQEMEKENNIQDSEKTRTKTGVTEKRL